MPPPSVELLFLGTGTSSGVPMIGCDCPVCTSADPHDKRMRPSVVISYGSTRVLVDTTPELRLQALSNDVRRIEAVVYTHAHADHVMGLDDLRRFNHLYGGPLDVWGDRKTLDMLKRCFAYAFKDPDPNCPNFLPRLVPREITGPFDIGPMRWTPVPLLHGGESVLGFRVGRVAYCTDVSEIPEASFALLEDLDVLVLDGLRPEPHNKHFSLDQAKAAATRIGARQTLFTHIAHNMAHAQTNACLPGGMALAYDGQRVTGRGK